MSAFEWVSVFIVAAVSVNFIGYLRKGELKKDFSSFRTLRNGKWLYVIPACVGLVAVTLFIGYLIHVYGGPVARWTWLYLIQSSSESQGGTNLLAAGVKIPIFGWLFLILFGLNVPRLARNEELAFRLHVRSCPEAIKQSIKFGFAHCIVGIPLSFGLALAIPGLVFAYAYGKGGTRLSTAWHAVYNYVILCLITIFMLSQLK